MTIYIYILLWIILEISENIGKIRNKIESDFEIFDFFIWIFDSDPRIIGKVGIKILEYGFEISIPISKTFGSESAEIEISYLISTPNHKSRGIHCFRDARVLFLWTVHTLLGTMLMGFTYHYNSQGIHCVVRSGYFFMNCPFHIIDLYEHVLVTGIKSINLKWLMKDIKLR